MSVHNTLYVQDELFVNKIDGTVLSTSDWAYLGTIDQNMAKANEVEFKSVTLNNATATTKIQTGATGNYTLTLPVDDGTSNQVLSTNGSGVLSWASVTTYNQSLNTSNSVQFVDLTLTGNLTVSGTTTLINTTNTEIKDNILILNNGETGAGVGNGTGTCGLEIERGTLTNTYFLYDEAKAKWTVGTGTTPGTDNFVLAEIDTTTVSTGAVPAYNAAGRLGTGISSATVTSINGISVAQWGYLGNMNQNVATTSNVTFGTITASTNVVMSGNAGVVESVSALLTADPAPVAKGVTLFNATAANRTATLPANSAVTGKTFTIMLVSTSGGNTLTINVDGSDTIDGSLSSVVLNVAGQHIKLTSLGTGNWIIV
jgi:hypothetical protein